VREKAKEEKGREEKMGRRVITSRSCGWEERREEKGRASDGLAVDGGLCN
jgi:hypothetical protein